MGDLLFYVAALVFVIALIVLGAWLWRSMIDNGVNLPGSRYFAAPRDRRIGAVETVSIDGHRKLVLVRRDNVEHLIMTGGPIDVVIETGIMPPHAPQAYDPAAMAYAHAHQGGSLENRLYGVRSGDEH